MKRFLVGALFLGALGYVATNWAGSVKADATTQLEKHEQNVGTIAADITKRGQTIAENPAAPSVDRDYNAVMRDAEALHNSGQQLGEDIQACRELQREQTQEAEAGLKSIIDPILRRQMERRWKTADAGLKKKIAVAEQAVATVNEAEQSAADLKASRKVIRAAETEQRSGADLEHQTQQAKLAANKFVALTSSLVALLSGEAGEEVAGS